MVARQCLEEYWHRLDGQVCNFERPVAKDEPSHLRVRSRQVQGILVFTIVEWTKPSADRISRPYVPWIAI